MSTATIDFTPEELLLLRTALYDAMESCRNARKMIGTEAFSGQACSDPLIDRQEQFARLRLRVHRVIEGED